jgi:excisionase family DNA binding protein
MPAQQPQSDLLQSDLLTETQAAKLLSISVATLQTWRSRKRYALRFYRIGSRVRYRLVDIEAFIQSRAVEPIEPRHFAEQRAKRKAHRAELARATARPAERPRTKPKAKRARS